MNIDEMAEKLLEPEEFDFEEAERQEAEAELKEAMDEAIRKILLNVDSELDEFLEDYCCNKLECLKKIRTGIEDLMEDFIAYREKIFNTVPPGRIAKHYPELLNL